jgi:hypothetical protein
MPQHGHTGACFFCRPLRWARLPFRTIRPSLLDLRFTGDPWVVGRSEQGASLCLDNYQLATLSAVCFDLPSLNRTLCHLRRPSGR